MAKGGGSRGGKRPAPRGKGGKATPPRARGPQEAVRRPQEAARGPKDAEGATPRQAPGPQEAPRGPQGAARAPQGAARAPQDPPRAPQDPPPGPFVLGAIPGATPGKWIDTWKERMPHTPLELRPIDVAGQRAALLEGGLDAALVRLPIDRTGLHVIPLYDEVPVVVASAESHLMAAEELALDDLVGEVVITPRDDVLGIDVPGAVAPVFDAPETTGDAVATVAAGVGILIVPMSLARLHHRKDAGYRPLTDGPMSTVALAWPADRPAELVDVFVGIVRGRTANSSRG